jgi:hypothetical protein
MSFDTQLPDHYQSVQKQLRSLNYERLDLCKMRDSCEPCGCTCSGCEDNCEGYIFEDWDGDIENLEKEIERLEAEMLDLRQTIHRLERYAKFRHIELAPAAPVKS